MRKIILSLLTLSVLSGVAFASQPNFDLRDVVPFKLLATNKVDVILGQQEMLSLGFIFSDGTDQAPVDRAALLRVLHLGLDRDLHGHAVILELRIRVDVDPAAPVRTGLERRH